MAILVREVAPTTSFNAGFGPGGGEPHAAPSVVFDLELDVDVHAASMRGSQETATTSSGRRQLTLGDEVTFRARHLGVRWRMTSPSHHL
ncbi:hypothetical protein GCM10022225_83820 [Plantactinospora mayteni]|uniref:Uncharacterized protein n=1 Tax=Plantactinospora mayteni TaxID=566021 RepID=A0ABQ4F4J5_9ACTN|nr:hypothetical protein [Plantactinospora mayteni]GIH01827.1 hypothetical protein Pma05_83990 [Plantactinospora mayteni]